MNKCEKLFLEDENRFQNHFGIDKIIFSLLLLLNVMYGETEAFFQKTAQKVFSIFSFNIYYFFITLYEMLSPYHRW